MTSSFDPSNKRGATFGTKRRDKVESTPGPGSYSNPDAISVTKKKGASVRIGSTKRPDNFAKKEVLPGPGNYIGDAGTFGKSVKGAASMGSKHKAVVNSNPGPGAYSGEYSVMKASKTANCKIGTTARPDLWDTKKQGS